MKRSALMCVAAVAVWSTGVFAQGRNFAGNWTIDAERTQAAMAAAGGAAGGGVMRGGGGGGGRGGGGAVAAGAVEERRPTVAGAGAVMAAGGGGARGGGGGRGGGPSGPTAIALDANTFTVGEVSYKLDGSVTTSETLVGVQTAKAGWKSDKLVIEITTQTQNGPAVSTQTWYLEGDSLVRETSRPSPDGGEPRVNKIYYKRS